MAVIVRAGQFCRRAAIQEPRDTPGVTGRTDLSDDANWNTVGIRRCRFVTRGGRERVFSDQVSADVTHVIEMRSDSVTRSIHPKMRLNMCGRIFNIAAAYDVNEERRIVRIEATEPR